MMPTRLPANSMPSFGQRWVWHDWPVKLSMPGMVGITAAERTPIAVTRKRVEWRAPLSSTSSQLRVSSRQWAAVTRLLNWMSRRRSNLSAT